MLTPPRPRNDDARVASLRALNLTRQKTEERFERLTHSVKRLFGVPVAGISLVEEELHWFKALHGLKIHESHRNDAFCSWTILGDGPFVVTDTLEDPRFIRHPMVVGGPHVRFYAGQPLRAMDGHNVGTLCLFDFEPRTLRAEALQLLAELGAWAESEINAGKLSLAQQELRSQVDAVGTPHHAGPHNLIGTSLGHYMLVGVIGEGGIGRVYRAIHPHIGAQVAIKVLRSSNQDNDEVVQRFFAEARAVNRIRHQNIVQIVDLGETDTGRPYLVMEFLEGTSLANLISAHGPLPFGVVIEVGLAILSALQAAHASKVVHRDLKPHNVMVTSAGAIKVLDFGVAKMIDTDDADSQTGTGAVLGTPAYMSPEQAEGLADVDARADLYSFGIVLYEMLTGRRPFNATSQFSMLRAQVEDAPPSVQSGRDDVPVGLERLVMKLLEKNPANRFASAQECARSLEEAVPSFAREGDSLTTLVAAAMARPAADTVIESALPTRPERPGWDA